MVRRRRNENVGDPVFGKRGNERVLVIIASPLFFNKMLTIYWIADIAYVLPIWYFTYHQ